MSGRPWPFDGEVGCDSGDVPNLKPSENNVKCRCVADKAKCVSNLLGSSKASKEKKQIADANLLVREMALRGIGLAEDRTPSRSARDGVASQIGIKMRTVVSADTSASQVFDNPSDPQAVERRNFGVSGRRTRIGNRKRAKLTVQDWTRASAVRRIESLAAEDEFHRSRIVQPCYISRRTLDKENFDAGF